MADAAEVTYRLYTIRRPLSMLALLGVLVAAIYFFSKPYVPALKEATPQPSLADSIRTGKAPIPPLTEATKAKMTPGGFQALVSYTDNGFEPGVVSIHTGDTIRFTNNSSRDVWIASQGGDVQIYPRQGGCGSSALDSCSPFAPQDFWEFTFDVPGEWHVVNNLDKEKGGVVIVR